MKWIRHVVIPCDFLRTLLLSYWNKTLPGVLLFLNSFLWLPVPSYSQSTASLHLILLLLQPTTPLSHPHKPPSTSLLISDNQLSVYIFVPLKHYTLHKDNSTLFNASFLGCSFFFSCIGPIVLKVKRLLFSGDLRRWVYLRRSLILVPLCNSWSNQLINYLCCPMVVPL